MSASREVDDGVATFAKTNMASFPPSARNCRKEMVDNSGCHEQYLDREGISTKWRISTMRGVELLREKEEQNLLGFVEDKEMKGKKRKIEATRKKKHKSRIPLRSYMW